MRERRKIVFKIDGGIGKNVVATAVCKAIKSKYPDRDLIVVTAYPDVFLSNPNVFKVYGVNDLAYFYQTHIEDQDVKMMVHNPYLATDFVTYNGHLIKVWCELFEIPYNGEQPELYLTKREIDFYTTQFPTDKPLFVLQSHGGTPDQRDKYSWARDIPIVVAQRVVAAFRHSHHILHIRREDQPSIEGTIPVVTDFRAIAVLLLISDKRLLIDSFAHHTAAALGMPSVVCWIANKPEQFGYQLHNNILANPFSKTPELRNSVYHPFNFSGDPLEFPYQNEEEIFDTHGIINALNGTANIGGEESGFVLQDKVVRDRIMMAYNRGSMVAGRLVWLLQRVNLGLISTVVDIGSWHLQQSIEFAQLFPNATIHAFEPVPDSYELCLSNRNSLSPEVQARISVHNTALGNVTGTIPFYQVDAELSSFPNIGASSMFKFIEGLNGTPFGQNLVQKEIAVEADTLDSWCEKQNLDRIDIMWMDVQGAELLVLEGAQKMLEKTTIILTEVGLKAYYDGHTLKSDIDDLLRLAGFEEVTEGYEVNVTDYEANAIYIKTNMINA